MFAVIKTGGKQFKIAKGDVLEIEKIEGAAGETVTFTEVLATGESGKLAQIGTPFIEGATVTAELLEQTKDDKVIIFKKKRRHNYRRRNGHRQPITIVRITDILIKGAKKADASEAAAKKAKIAEE